MWQPIRGIGNPISIRQFSGVYKPEDEGFNLSDEMFTEMINFCPDAYPAIKTRPGYSVIGTFGATVLGLGAWKGIELHAVFSDGSWRKWNGSAWTSLATGLSTTAEWTFTNFKGNLAGINLIGSNGVDPIKRYDGSSVQNLSNAPTGGNYITTQSNRLYCAVLNKLAFSALNEADDWTTVDDAGEIGINTTDGATINGLSAGNGFVNVFTPAALFELYGKGPQSYSMDLIAADIGATGNKAIVTYDETLPFIGRDGIYRYSGGIRPTREYSLPVQGFVDSGNKSSLSRCVAGNDGSYLYFGLPIGSSSENNRILQFDPLHSSWYTWDGIAVTQMLRVGADMYFGDATGRVLKLGGTTDNSVPITSIAITKPFTAASISRKQQWYKLWVVASVPAGSTLQVFVSGYASGDSWILANTITAETDIQYKELLIPLGKIQDKNAVRIKLVGMGPVTIHEITRQLRELPMRR